MRIEHRKFPYEYWGRDTGEPFQTIAECRQAGFALDQIWGLIHDVEANSMIFAPRINAMRALNHIGYVCTIQINNGREIYEEHNHA